MLVLCLPLAACRPQTLKAAYGPEGAAAITPLSFALPDEMGEWQQWLSLHGARGQQPGASSAGVPSADTGFWILKTGQRRRPAVGAASQACCCGTCMWTRCRDRFNHTTHCKHDDVLLLLLLLTMLMLAILLIMTVFATWTQARMPARG